MQHFEGFVRTVAQLLATRHFDAVIAPYNSGAIMVAIARMVSDACGNPLPRATLLPVFSPYWFGLAPGSELPFDREPLTDLARASLPPDARSLLFFDDEIGHGSAYFACTTAAQRALDRPLSCTIVAEENGFRTDYPSSNVSFELVPYARRPDPTRSGFIYAAIPDRFTDPFPNTINRKQALCILLDLPTKDLTGRTPVVSRALEKEVAPRVPELSRLRSELHTFLIERIRIALARVTLRTPAGLKEV